MSDEMTPDSIDAIRARAKREKIIVSHAHIRAQADRDTLLAEVDRLLADIYARNEREAVLRETLAAMTNQKPIDEIRCPEISWSRPQSRRRCCMNPGSDEAQQAGCLCPVMDNHYGKGWHGGVKDVNGATVFVVNGDCPMHGEDLLGPP